MRDGNIITTIITIHISTNVVPAPSHVSPVLTESARSADLWSTPGVFPGTHCLLGAAATSGALTKWVRDHLSDGWSFEQLTKQAGLPARREQKLSV